MRDLTNRRFRRILVCQQRQIGDVLLATPALELLRRRFPDAEIHLFTEKKCEPLLRHNPHVDILHLLDKAAQPSLGSQLAWYRRESAGGFDLAVDFQQLPRCAMMVLYSRAPVRLSCPAPWYRRFLYTHQAEPLPGYAAASKASLLAPLGIVWSGERPRVYLKDDERDEAHLLLNGLGLRPEQRLITVDATHRRASKRWPAASFARLIDLLSGADTSLRFLLLRGPGEDEEVRALRELCARKDAVLLPDTLPSLRISAACIEAATLHIGNCSAPRHIAVAVDTPSLVIPGASGPEWTYPDPLRHLELRPDLPCQPCSRTECADPRCLTLVTPELALAAARGMLEREGR